jgi:hypothetical protein
MQCVQLDASLHQVLVADIVSPCNSTCIQECVPSRLRVCNKAFVKTLFLVGYCTSVREFNLMIIYQCSRVRERTCKVA